MQPKHLLPILLILISQSIFSQNKNSFIESQQTIPFQKLYLHTDRDFYFFGDTIWFAGYLLHQKTHAPLKTDCNLYVEIADSAGQSVQKEIFPIQQGFCPGQLTLNKKEFREGNYLIRAYSDLLGAYGDDLIFSKAIRISPVKNMAGLEAKDTQKIITNVNLDLFPEGGFLLAGKYNQMAFKTTDQSGRAVEISGRMLNSKGEEIFKFSSLYNGMGIIYFVPEQREIYSVEIEGIPNVNYTFPEIRDTGAKLMTYRQNSLGLEVNIVKRNTSPNQKFYLASLYRGELASFAEIAEKEKIAYIKNSLLKHGINRLVLLNENFKPVSERLVFVDKNEDAALKIKLNQHQFFPREKVEIEIEGDKNISKNEIANLSLSVIDKNSIPASGVSQNIKSYLLMDSELKGYISNPSDYFTDALQISSARKLDLLMMTHGWSNYIWNNLAKKDTIPDVVTRFGIDITGTLKNSGGTKILPGSEVTLGVSGETNEFMDFTHTDSTGNYKFNNVQFYDSATVFVQGRNQRDKTNTTITLDSIYFHSPELTNAECAKRDHFTKIPISMLRRKYFNEEKLNAFFPDRDTRLIKEVKVTADKMEIEPNQGRYKIYSEPTYTLEVKEKEYVYPSVFDFLKGRIPGRIPDLILIDGVEVYGTEYFPVSEVVRTIPMMEIDRVDILKHAAGAFYGSRGANGVINIILRLGGEYIPPADPSKGTIVKRIQGFSSYREFYSPKYIAENIDYEIPDYRTTLYWNPSVILENGKTNLSFFTCDNVAGYSILVEGITKNGNICLGEAEFEVNKPDDETSENQ